MLTAAVARRLYSTCELSTLAGITSSLVVRKEKLADESSAVLKSNVRCELSRLCVPRTLYSLKFNFISAA